MSKLPEYADGLHPLDTVVFLKALDFGSRSREKGRVIRGRMSSMLSGCRSVFPALFCSLGEN